MPLLVGTTVLKGLQGWHQKHRAKRVATERSLLGLDGPSKDVTLEWDELQCTLTDKEGKERRLLQDMRGSAQPGRCAARPRRRRQAAGRGAAQAANAPCAPSCLQAAAACARPSSLPAVPCRLQAIMGPSGSGKTTLLSALAGQLPYTPGMELRGSITLNGEALGKAKAQTGFVQQEDIFYSQLSVK